MSEPPKQVISLPESYQRARRMLVLFSGLLFAWAFIGVELPTKAATEGITIFGANVIIKSPQAIPFVLLSLIVYFAYRLLIEWNLLDAERRRQKWVRLDFRTTLGFGVAGLLVYGVQALSNIQIADYILRDQVALFASSFLLGLLVTTVFGLRRHLARFWKVWLFLLSTIGLVIFALLIFWLPSMTSWKVIMLAVVFAAGLGLGLALIVRPVLTYKPAKQQTSANKRI